MAAERAAWRNGLSGLICATSLRSQTFGVSKECFALSERDIFILKIIRTGVC